MTKLFRFAGVALLALTIGVASCGDDDDPVAPVVPVAPTPIVGTVSGTVSVEGSGLEGVSVNLLGAASQSKSTGSGGGYSFADVPAGTHIVQISGAPADVAFDSKDRPVTIATSGQTATADFSGKYIRTEISGTVVTAGGEGVVATVTATGKGLLMDEQPKVGTSDTDGDFVLPGLRAGDYMVTISDFDDDHEFAVSSRAVTVVAGQSASVTFVAEAEPEVTTGSITGEVVTAAGDGIVATVTAVGTGEDGVTHVGTSNTDGDYELPGVEAGDYRVTISDFGDHEFDVSSRAVTVVAGQSASVTFVAEAVPEPEVTTGSITGEVVTAAGDGIVATVTAVGTGEDGVTHVGTSNTDGDYELPGVEAGDYRVTISEFGDHEFVVSSRAVTVVAGQSASVTFVAGPEPEVTTGSITGEVVTAAGDGIVATVTAVGTGEDGVTHVGTSNTDGDYELPGVEAGDYTVTISDFGDHEFAVSSRTVTVVAGQSASVTFVAEAVPEPEVTTGSITGEVVTAAGDGIVATVTAVGTGEDGVTHVETSNTDGDYELPGVEAGDYTVTISEFGDHEFDVSSRAVTVVAGQSASVSFVAEEEEAGPTTGPEVLVYITGVTDDDGDPDKTSGLVTATMFFERERGDPLPEKIALYVDGAEVATRGLGGGGAARAAEAPALAAQQGGVEFSLSFDSEEYHPETGAVTYLNGAYVILMGVTFMGSEAENVSPPWDVELENDGGYVVTADLGDNGVIGDDGRRWYGGPDNGPIDITALLVSYTGGSVTSVSADFCGEEATESDGTGGYTFEFKCEDRESNTDADKGLVGDMLILSSPGEDGVILNDDHPFPAFVDFVGPTNSPIIVANRNGREDGWLNAAVALTGEVDADEDDDENWLVKGADEPGGIGGYNMMLRIGEDLEAALDASPGSALPDESADNESYCAFVSATDDLGNMSERPDDEAMCRPAPAGADALYDDDDNGTTADVYGQDIDDTPSLSGQTLEFGVDVTDPTIEFDGGPEDEGRYNGDTPIPSGETDGTEFIVDDDENDVGNSGLSDVADATPVMVTVRRHGTDDEVVCPMISSTGDVAAADNDADCEGMLLEEATRLTFASPAVGNYMLDASVKDRAGNSGSADPIAFVFDNDPAEVTPAAVPFEIDAGERFEMVASLNDNLSIRDYYVTVNFGDAIELGVGIPVPVDAVDADPRTKRNHTVIVPAIGFGTPIPIMAPYAGTQSALATTIQVISGVTVGVRDQTQAAYTESTGGAAFPTVMAPAADKGFGSDANFTFALSVDDVCVEGDTDDCAVDDEPTTSDLEFVATRAVGTFRDPFERVDFWMQDVNGQHWLLGSDDSGVSGRNDDSDRTWTYSLNDVSGAMLYRMTRAAGFMDDDQDMYTVRAFAVNGDGVALIAVDNMVVIDPD